MNSEQVVLVDDDGNEIGVALKSEVHHADTPLHRAFSCYIFNDENELLVTQRAHVKKVWPGVWTNSVCGHPAPFESFEAAIARRSEQELGMEIAEITVLLPEYRYKTPPFNGIIENEVCPVYAARAASAVKPNADEVEDFAWMRWDDWAHELLINPDQYSYWAKDQLKQLVSNELLEHFLTKQ